MKKITNFSFCIILVIFVSFFSTFASKAEEIQWLSDFEAAKTKAKTENKYLLVNFTGSDWCSWCKKLKNEVFDKDKFQTLALKRFVFVELDYPHQKELPEEIKTQNIKLAKLYKVQGFPTVLMTDSEGQVIARTGYRPDGPEKYVEQLAEFEKTYKSILQLKAELKNKKSLDRAVLLDKLIEAYQLLNNETDEVLAWNKEIVELDPENKAGLKHKYEFRILMAEAMQLRIENKLHQIPAVIEKALAVPELTANQKFDAYELQALCYYANKDFPKLVASLAKAIEADPKNAKADELKKVLDRFTEIAKMQENVDRIKSELEKSKGIDRAKILDQLITAKDNLNKFIPDPSFTEEIGKLCNEIISLDPDNKAGLKKKYEAYLLLAQAKSFFSEQKIADAQDALDKYLKYPDQTPEQIQEAYLIKALCYSAQNKPAKHLDSLKKALEIAPNSTRSALINRLIKIAEKESDQKNTN